MVCSVTLMKDCADARPIGTDDEEGRAQRAATVGKDDDDDEDEDAHPASLSETAHINIETEKVDCLTAAAKTRRLAPVLGSWTLNAGESDTMDADCDRS